MAWRVSALTNVQLGLQLQLPLPPPVVTTQAMCGQHSSPTLDSLTEAPEQGLAPGGGCGGANAEQAHPHNLSPKLGQALQAGINSSA